MGHLRTLHRTGIVLTALALVAVSSRAADRVKVTIVDRQGSSIAVNYLHPGYANSNSTGSATCSVNASVANCSGSSTTTGTYIPAQSGTYDVEGATLAIKLADGRIVIVNCSSKYQFKADYANRRSCRIPPVNEIEAEFDGDKAKLLWPVSLSGKKMESETYKIVSVPGTLPPASAPTSSIGPPAFHQ